MNILTTLIIMGLFLIPTVTMKVNSIFNPKLSQKPEKIYFPTLQLFTFVPS